jgi:hypothetical protein
LKDGEKYRMRIPRGRKDVQDGREERYYEGDAGMKEGQRKARRKGGI